VIRLFSIEVALFLAPFAAYVLFLWAVREGILHPDRWSLRVLALLSAAAIALTAVGFVYIAEHSRSPPHSTYVPAHLENGVLVPGTIK
jgi:hypothetical protein